MKKYFALWIIARKARRKDTRTDLVSRKESASSEKKYRVTSSWKESKELRKPCGKCKYCAGYISGKGQPLLLEHTSSF